MKNPKQKYLIHLLLVLVYVSWLFLYFTGISTVPFHPDESTYIFMSQDVDKMLSGQLSELFYNVNTTDPISQQYRLLDAPITRYAIGIARFLTSTPPLPQDWDWSKSWEQNSAAQPDSRLLIIARLGIAIFLPLTLFFYYLLIKRTYSTSIAILSSLLLMMNSIILLHTRRAMAEGGLIFFIIFSIFILIRLPKKWLFLSAIPITLAINAKQSAVFFILIGIGSLIYMLRDSAYKALKQLFLFGVLFLALFFLLNPVMWSDPFAVAKKMIESRSILTQNQVEAINSIKHEFILNSLPKKTIGLIGQLFLVAPATEDVSNYSQNLHNATVSYFQNPLNRGIGRTTTIAGIGIFLITIGIIDTLKKRCLNRLIILSTFFVLTLGILFSFTIPFQRYYLPIFPFLSLYTANGFITIFIQIKNHLAAKNKVIVG